MYNNYLFVPNLPICFTSNNNNNRCNIHYHLCYSFCPSTTLCYCMHAFPELEYSFFVRMGESLELISKIIGSVLSKINETHHELCQ